MIRKLMSLIIFLFVGAIGCTRVEKPVGPSWQAIDSAEMSSLIINFSAPLETERRLRLEDSRIVYDESILKIYLEYSSQALLDMCEARLLMVEIVDEFLKRLNNHTVLGFQLEHFPFTADDLEVKINFESFFGVYVDPLYIGLTWLKSGCVYYYAFDIKDPYADWSHQRFEPYFKSRELALIKKEADIPFQDRENPPKRPSSYVYDRYTPRMP